MPRPMSPEEYQELGRRYYKLKQYEKALETFSAGIEAAPSLSLYDHRAACYDRLKDFNAAIKDGRSMIKIDKQDVKGYLRTASVLEKMDKLDTALGIYKYGMKNVPVSDKNFKLLQQLHDKTTRKLSPAKAVDPLSILPRELAEMVLDHLSFRHMVNCMRVSKGWRDYIAGLDRLWKHLDLSDAKRPVSRVFIDKATRMSKYKLNRFTIHRFQHLDVVLKVAKACKDLADVELLSLPLQASDSLIELARLAPKLKRYVIHTDISQDTVFRIMSSRPTLEHAEFRAMNESRTITRPTPPIDSIPLPNLLSLRVDTQNSAPLATTKIFEQAAALQTLVLSKVLPTMRIHRLPLRTVILNSLPIPPPRLPSTVEHFTWNSSFTSAAVDQWEQLYYSKLSSLTHLTVKDLGRASSQWFHQVLGHYIPIHDGAGPPGTHSHELIQYGAPLQYLSIKGTLADGERGLFAKTDPTHPNPLRQWSLFGRSPRILTPALKHLAIADLPCDDDEIEHLVSYNLRLEYIDLSASNITGAGIKMLADGIPTLKHIRADNASRINGRDAIEYAERKGIKISCSMTEGRGGKKVRYV